MNVSTRLSSVDGPRVSGEIATPVPPYVSLRCYRIRQLPEALALLDNLMESRIEAGHCKKGIARAGA
jgi:hypothetical protein